MQGIQQIIYETYLHVTLKHNSLGGIQSLGMLRHVDTSIIAKGSIHLSFSIFQSQAVLPCIG